MVRCITALAVWLDWFQFMNYEHTVLIGVKRVISALQHGVSRTRGMEFILFDPVQEK